MTEFETRSTSDALSGNERGWSVEAETDFENGSLSGRETDLLPDSDIMIPSPSPPDEHYVSFWEKQYPLIPLVVEPTPEQDLAMDRIADRVNYGTARREIMGEL